MTVRKELIVALLAVFIVFLLSVTYSLSTLELRVGQIEHFLIHQGFLESHCRG